MGDWRWTHRHGAESSWRRASRWSGYDPAPMIRARATAGEREIVILGLSAENVARLFASEPIVVRVSQPPPDGLASRAPLTSSSWPGATRTACSPR